MTEQNRRLVLAERPKGMVDDGTVRTEQQDVPVAGAGEALAKVRYLSIDPTIRTWMDDAPGYLPPIGIGEVIRSGGHRRGAGEQHRHLQAGPAAVRDDRLAGLRDRRRRSAGPAGPAPGCPADHRPRAVRDHRHDGLLRPARRGQDEGGRRGGRLGRGRGDRLDRGADRQDQGRQEGDRDRRQQGEVLVDRRRARLRRGRRLQGRGRRGPPARRGSRRHRPVLRQRRRRDPQHLPGPARDEGAGRRVRRHLRATTTAARSRGRPTT